MLSGAIAHNTMMTDLTLWRESGLNTLVRAMAWLGEGGSELVLDEGANVVAVCRRGYLVDRYRAIARKGDDFILVLFGTRRG